MKEIEELKKEIEQHILEQKAGWGGALDERQRKLVDNCRTYAGNDPAGLPGHNLMIVIDLMAAMLDAAHAQGYRGQEPPESVKGAT